MGLEMALNGIVTMLHIVDILYYTEVDDGRGIGNMIGKNGQNDHLRPE